MSRTVVVLHWRFGIDCITYDPAKTEEFCEQKGVKKCATLEELLSHSDYVFLHTPLFKETVHMINEDTISKMKTGAILINVSRGQLVDEKALIEAIKSGKLSGARLDVLEDEESHETELYKFENVVITPHAAFLSEESLKQSRKMALSQLVKKLVGDQELDYLVN